MTAADLITTMELAHDAACHRASSLKTRLMVDTLRTAEHEDIHNQRAYMINMAHKIALEIARLKKEQK